MLKIRVQLVNTPQQPEDVELEGVRFAKGALFSHIHMAVHVLCLSRVDTLYYAGRLFDYKSPIIYLMHEDQVVHELPEYPVWSVCQTWESMQTLLSFMAQDRVYSESTFINQSIRLGVWKCPI